MKNSVVIFFQVYIYKIFNQIKMSPSENLHDWKTVGTLLKEGMTVYKGKI